MPSSTYNQAIQVARERFTALNSLNIGDFNSFKEHMEVYNTLWEQGMEMMNFAHDVEEEPDDTASSQNSIHFKKCVI